MAADGWFYSPWFVSGYFPPVWFAPADETHIDPKKKRRGGMSYDQVLAATVDYRNREKTLADLRKKKRRGRRAREREQLMLLALPALI